MNDKSGIYVEILVKGSLDELWLRTQNPELHERWDVRFSSIRYLPRPDSTQPQRFSYSTRLGFGLRIEGEGESVGSRLGDRGEQTSSLRFWSDDWKSLIREGSGYWKYIPTEDGVRFLTRYDYKTRFGLLGRMFDAVVFRPILGWGTAWSFDRLRLWLERGLDPEVSLERSLVHAVARMTLVLIFFHQGLVPKLIFRSPDELSMLSDAGEPAHLLGLMLAVLGIVEIGWALTIAFLGDFRWLLAFTSLGMVGAIVAISIRSPTHLTTAFNPVSLNLSVVALCLVAWLTSADRPSATRCLRRQKDKAR